LIPTEDKNSTRELVFYGPRTFSWTPILGDNVGGLLQLLNLAIHMFQIYIIWCASKVRAWYMVRVTFLGSGNPV
jgi:hypothetical protein